MKRFLSVTFIVALVLSAVTLSASAAGAPELSAKGAILCAVSDDGLYDLVLYEKNADEQLYPASLTKIMTAIIALENESDLDAEFIAYAKSLEPLGKEVYYLMPGEKMAFRDYLNLMLVPSYNEAANVIAYNIGGSIEDFVVLMNEKAAELGCTNTHFANAHGLHDQSHYTSARDMLIISRYAMQNETFAEIVAQTSITLPVTNKHKTESFLRSTNHLLHNKSQPGYVYQGTLGIKTGSTTPAGYCLSAAFAAEGMTYYSVVLGSSKNEDGRLGSFLDTRALFNHGKDDFSEQPILKATQPIVELPVTLSPDGTSVVLLPERSVSDFLPKTFDYLTDLHIRAEGEPLPDGFDPKGKVILTYTVPAEVEAPIEKGQELGTLRMEFDGREICTMGLLSSLTLSKSEVLDTVDTFQTFVQTKMFKYIIIGILALIVVLFVVVIVIVSSRRKKRRRYGRSRYGR